MSNLELLSNEDRRTNGKDIRKFNIHASRLIKGLIESSFGPEGNEKIYIDIIGEATLTKDGAAFLRKIDVQHPAAKVLIDAANTVDNEVGDGTLSVAIIAAVLLEKAEEMLSSNLYPATISNGYSLGLQYSLEALNKISKNIKKFDMSFVQKILSNAFGTKILFFPSDQPKEKSLVDVVFDAINTVYTNNGDTLDIDSIKIEQKLGNVDESRLIDGILIDKTIDNDNMPRVKENTTILLLDDDLEPQRTRTEAILSIKNPKNMGLFYIEENNMIKEKIQKIVDCGVDVVFCRKGIGLFAQDLLSKAGIISVRRVKENDLHWLEKATGGKIMKELDVKDIKENLGFSGKVYEKKINDDKMVFVEKCNSPKAVTILIRANSKMVLDEYHRAIVRGITMAKRFIQNPSIVIGGGSCEAILAHYIRKKAHSISGGEQIALTKFADAIEEIPLTLARNSGMNVIDSLIKLRHNLSKEIVDEKIKWFGIDASKRNICELDWELMEPSVVKEQVLITATEVSRLLVNVDDIIIKKPLMNTHTHEDGTVHSHEGGNEKHDHYFDKLGKQQRPNHHYY
ncbi:MAG: thermosome subunit alpha [Candidatus Nitrosocosmicus sp.]|nr:thermosome subunit [Candidatus Nitrosocosmicus sp.]